MKKINYFIDGIYYSKLWKFMMKDHLPFQYIMNWNNLDRYICKYLSEKENCSADDFLINKKTLYFPHSIEGNISTNFFESIKKNNIEIKYTTDGRKNTLEHFFTWDTADAFYSAPFDYAILIVQNNEYIPVIEGLRREGVKSFVLYLSDISKSSANLLRTTDFFLDMEYLFDCKDDIDAKSVFIRKVIDNNVKESDKRFYKFLRTGQNDKVYIFYIHRSLKLQVNVKKNILFANEIELNSEIDNPIKISLYTFDGQKYYACFKTFEEFKNAIATGIEVKSNVETFVIDATLDSQNAVNFYFDNIQEFEFIHFPEPEKLTVYNHRETNGVSKKEFFKLLLDEEKKTKFQELPNYDETITSLKLAYENKNLVPGFIDNTINGGFTVNVGNGIKGFLPLGKADPGMIADTSNLIGATSYFYIEELVLEDQFNLVLNRKSYIKEKLLNLKLETN